MKDEEIWRQAVRQVTREFFALEPPVRQSCFDILDDMFRLKTLLAEFSDGAGGAGICRQCGGACCVRGKYHLTLPDLLGLLHRQVSLPTPHFERFPACPYLGEEGCQMSAGLRPFTCVIFNCELIEDRMARGEQERFRSLEYQLRSCYIDLEELFGSRFMGGLLRTYQSAGGGSCLGGHSPAPSACRGGCHGDGE
jgi:hypothetical protein